MPQTRTPALTLGDNIVATRDNEAGTLTLTIDTNVDGTPSASGKSMLVATTKGNQALAVGDRVLKIGLNLYEPI